MSGLWCHFLEGYAILQLEEGTSVWVPYNGACVPINQPDEADQDSDCLGLIAEWWIVAYVQ